MFLEGNGFHSLSSPNKALDGPEQVNPNSVLMWLHVSEADLLCSRI